MNGYRRILGIGSTLAMLGAGAIGAAPAQAANVSCGQTITASITLTGNVGPCLFGIDIAASNVVIDLNGFTISGTTGIGEGPGIQVIERSGVIIRNGTVTGFDTGVYLESTTRSTVTGMTVVGNVGTGIFDEGIQLYLSDNNNILRNTVNNNGKAAGIDVFDGSYNLVDGNSVNYNNIQGGIDHHGSQQNIGIWIVYLGDRAAPTTGNIVSNNKIDHSGLDGIQFSRSSVANTAKANTITNSGLTGGSSRDGDGIALFGQRNYVQGNDVSNSGQSGIHVYSSGANNIIQSNRVSNSNIGPNPDVQYDMFDAKLACDGNIWQSNVFVTRNQTCIH